MDPDALKALANIPNDALGMLLKLVVQNPAGMQEAMKAATVTPDIPPAPIPTNQTTSAPTTSPSSTVTAQGVTKPRGDEGYESPQEYEPRRVPNTKKTASEKIKKQVLEEAEIIDLETPTGKVWRLAELKKHFEIEAPWDDRLLNQFAKSNFFKWLEILFDATLNVVKSRTAFHDNVEITKQVVEKYNVVISLRWQSEPELLTKRRAKYEPLWRSKVQKRYSDFLSVCNGHILETFFFLLANFGDMGLVPFKYMSLAIQHVAAEHTSIDFSKNYLDEDDDGEEINKLEQERSTIARLIIRQFIALHDNKLGFRVGTEAIGEDYPEVVFTEKFQTPEHTKQWRRMVNEKMRKLYNEAALFYAKNVEMSPTRILGPLSSGQTYMGGGYYLDLDAVYTEIMKIPRRQWLAKYALGGSKGKEHWKLPSLEKRFRDIETTPYLEVIQEFPVQNVVPDVVYTSTTNTAASEGAGSHDEPESSDPKISELVAQIKLLQEQLAAANKSTQMSGKDMGIAEGSPAKQTTAEDKKVAAPAADGGTMVNETPVVVVVGEAVKPLEEVPPAKSLSNTSSPELTGSKQSDPKETDLPETTTPLTEPPLKQSKEAPNKIDPKEQVRISNPTEKPSTKETGSDDEQESATHKRKRSSDDTPSLGNKEQAKKKPTTRHTTKEAKAAKLAKINKALEIDMRPTPSSPLATSKKHEK